VNGLKLPLHKGEQPFIEKFQGISNARVIGLGHIFTS
jgi:hypothetical protein